MLQVKTQLRMPEAAHKWIVRRAKRNGRSMNAEINYLLKSVKEQEETQTEDTK